MKKLILLLTLFISINVLAQQEPIKICFKNINQADRQYHRMWKRARFALDPELIWEDIEIEGRCVSIEVENKIDKTKKLSYWVIRYRHRKYIVNPERFGFGQNYEYLKTKKR